MRRRYDWSAIQAFYDEGHTIRECQTRFGFANGAWDAAVGRGEIVPRSETAPVFRHETRDAVRELLDAGLSQGETAFRLGLSKATVCYDARRLGIEGDRRFGRRYDWAAIQRDHDAGMSMRECQRKYGFSSCEQCGIDEWRGEPLRVTLHHVNGDPYDNRLENLAFLCPNCHSQTPNFGGRNGHLRPASA